MKKYEVEITEEAEAFLEELKESSRKKFIKVFSKVELGFITKDDFIINEGGKEIATIVAINGYNKKGDKTPSSEIEKAKRLKKEFIS